MDHSDLGFGLLGGMAHFAVVSTVTDQALAILTSILVMVVVPVLSAWGRAYLQARTDAAARDAALVAKEAALAEARQRIAELLEQLTERTRNEDQGAG